MRCDPRPLQWVLDAAWHGTPTPLDTCGLIRLGGPDHQRILQSEHPVDRVILENSRLWAKRRPELAPANAEQQSSTLFDCAAVYLAVSEDLCTMEEIPIPVTSDGFTRMDAKGRLVRVVTEWKDIQGFHRWLADRIAGKSS
ncbi:MAG: hypothetical protein RMN51_00365 [Verrucomicrobiota bacterium]|nr:hypothetical protein [Limisphaera sp.]MDW8380554.1 hypothetical protein [Verrucomicrobiota bacterium]